MPTMVQFVLDDGSTVEAEVEDSVVSQLQSGIPFVGESVRRSVQSAEYLRRKINTTPFTYKPAPRVGGLYGQVAAVLGSADETKRRKMLAAEGITVGAGPFNKLEIDYFQSLAKDSPFEFAEFFIPKVKEKVAPDENIDPRNLVKVGEDGKVHFLDLQTKANPAGTNRWTEFQGFEIDPFSILEIGLDIAGSFSGQKLAIEKGLKPLKESVLVASGAAAGAGVAQLGRVFAGKAHGITQQISEDPEADPLKEGLATVGSAAKRSAIAAGSSLVGSGIGRTYYHYTRPPNPYFFNRDTARAFEESSAAGEQVVKDIRDLPGGEKFNPDQALVSGEQSLLTLRAMLRSRAGGASEMHLTGDILEQEETNDRILNNLLEQMLGGPKIGGERAGLEIKDSVLAEIAKMAPSKQRAKLLELVKQNKLSQGPLGPITEIAETGRQTLISRIRGAEELTEGLITTQEATGLQKILRGLQKSEQEAWEKFETLSITIQRNLNQPLEIKLAGNKDPELDLLPKLRGFLDLADRVWSPQAKRRFSSVLDPLKEAVDAAPDGMVSLHTVNANLSAMKESLRIAKKEIGQESPSVAALEAGVNSLQSVRDNYIKNVLRNPVLLDSLLVAEGATRRVNDLTKRSVASKFLVKDPSTGVYKIRNPDQTFQDIMIPGSDDGMRQWLDIVQDDPGIVQATKAYLGQHYYSSVIRNGLADPKAHQSWMRDFGSAAKLVFKEDFGAIQRLGQIGKLVQEGQKKLSTLEAVLRHSSRGKIARMDSEKVVDSILGASAREGAVVRRSSSLTLSETRDVVDILKSQSPETFGLLQDRAKEMIRIGLFGDPLTTRTSQKLGSEKLAKLLDETQEARLTFIMGSEFVSNLRKIKRGLELMERTAKGVSIPVENAPLSLFRAIFGPLSRTQRFISAGRRYNIIGYEKKLADIITDPAKLRKVMKAANMPARSPFAMATLMSVGFLEATD